MFRFSFCLGFVVVFLFTLFGCGERPSGLPPKDPKAPNKPFPSKEEVKAGKGNPKP